MSGAPERKWRMVRVGPGDWLLPSNDLRCAWRISTYWEDGSASYEDERGRDRVITGTYWRLRWHMRLDRDVLALPAGGLLGLIDGDAYWTDSDHLIDTRREAIDRAMISDRRRQMVDAEWDRAEAHGYP